MNYEFTYVNGTLTVLPNDEQGADTQNYLTIENITANKKAQVILPIGMKNQRSISGLQFDLYLPDGVTVATKSNGKRNRGGRSIDSSEENQKGTFPT